MRTIHHANQYWDKWVWKRNHNGSNQMVTTTCLAKLGALR